MSGLLAPAFLQHAFLAGTAVALAAGLVGYFLVLRIQIFTADALSHVAFTGAYAALAAGVDLRLGLFAATILVALAMGALGSAGGTRARPDDVVIGGVFAWILGLGAFFLSIYTASRSAGANGAASVNVLRGSIFGLSSSRALTTALIAAAVCLVIVAMARPLLFASLDDAVAASRGVPVRLLGYAFLVVVAVMTAESAQVVGPLLTLGMLAAPAGAATRLTTRPLVGMWVSAGIAAASVWIGLTLSYAVPVVPPSFGIVAVATATYLATFLRRPSSTHGPAPAGEW